MAGIKGFLETSFIDWPGRLAAVVFLPGCNFRCPFCHNGELVGGASSLPDIPLESVLERLGALGGWVDGVVVSGGEPTLHPGLEGMLRAFRAAGLAVKLDTNGSRPDVLAPLLSAGLLQEVAMDLKAPFREESHARLAGVRADLDALRVSVGLVAGSGVPHRFRTTWVPGLLSAGDVREIALSLPPSSPYTVQAFDPRRVLDPRLEKVRAPTERDLARLRRLAAAREAA